MLQRARLLINALRPAQHEKFNLDFCFWETAKGPHPKTLFWCTQTRGFLNPLKLQFPWWGAPHNCILSGHDFYQTNHPSAVIEQDQAPCLCRDYHQRNWSSQEVVVVRLYVDQVASLGLQVFVMYAAYSSFVGHFPNKLCISTWCRLLIKKVIFMNLYPKFWSPLFAMLLLFGCLLFRLPCRWILCCCLSLKSWFPFIWL